MYNSIADDANKLEKSKSTQYRDKMIEIFKQLQEIFIGAEADDKAYDGTDNEQLETTDMPDLETEESAAQRQNHEGEGLKIFTPEKMLTSQTSNFFSSGKGKK